MKSGYVAILGAPNVGKSSLLNRILDQKLAAVTSKPQTTRKRFLGIHSTDQAQILFLDTPGLHDSEKPLNRTLQQEIKKAIEDADLILLLTSVDKNIPDIRKLAVNKPMILAINKIDLLGNDKSPLQKIQGAFSGMTRFLISAKEGTGIQELIAGITLRLPEGPQYFPEDHLTDTQLRDIAPEIIREAAMEHLHEEIPYQLAVVVESFKEEEKITKIEANLIVERETQKRMVVGAGGKMIRDIGIQARTNLEVLLGCKIFLKLIVKVDPNWTKNPAKLRKYGYS